MPSVISFAGVLIATERLAFFLAILIAFVLIRLLTPGRPEERAHIERLGERLLLTVVIAARVGFVALNWKGYSSHPWKALFLWQSGYDVRVGAVAAILFFSVYLFVSVNWRRVCLLGGTFLVPLTAFLAFAMTFPYFQKTGNLGQGDRMPLLAMRTLDGARQSLEHYSGRPLVVNIWATWCLPCREEIPLLNQVAKDYAPEHVKVIGVNLAENAATVERFKENVPIDYPVWVDPKPNGIDQSPSRALFKQVGQVAVPTTLFIGCDGLIRHISVGELSTGKAYHQVQNILC